MQKQFLFLNTSAESLTCVAHVQVQAPTLCTVSISIQSDMEKGMCQVYLDASPPPSLSSPLTIGVGN